MVRKDFTHRGTGARGEVFLLAVLLLPQCKPRVAKAPKRLASGARASRIALDLLMGSYGSGGCQIGPILCRR